MIALIFLTNALFALGFPFGKLILSYGKPFFLTGLRLLLSGGGMLVWYGIQKRSLVHIKKQDVLTFLNLGFWGMGVSLGVGLWALSYVSSIKASFCYNLTPFITAFFSYLYFAEVITFKKWLGLLVGFVGMVPHLISGNGQQGTLMAIPFIPEFALFVAVVSNAYNIVATRRLVLCEYPPLIINGISMVIGGICSLGASWLFESGTRIIIMKQSLVLFAVPVLASAAGYILYSYLLRYYTATFLSFTSFMTPLFVALCGWLFLHEQLSWLFLFSVIMVVAGLFIFHYEELHQGYKKNNS
jgi:drug/metabolite transporter (DMT)-like permease